MNKTFIMGVLTAIAAVIGTYFQTNGFPSTTVGWEILGITIAGNVVIYVGKNAVLPSISLFGTIDTRDLLSGLVLAVGNSIVQFAASAITSTAVNWHLLLTTSASIAGTYLLSKFGFGKKS